MLHFNRLSALAALCTLASIGGVRGASPDAHTDVPPMLEAIVDPVYTIGLTHVGTADIDGGGDAGLVKLDAEWSLAYFTDILGGDIEGSLLFDMTFFTGSGGIDLPNQVLRFALDAVGTWRYVNGTAFQVRAKPGIYGDPEGLSGDAFSVPFSGLFVRSLSSRLAGVVGAEIRTDFERQIMPIVGLEWYIADSLQLLALIPESRLTFYPSGNWTAFVALDWSSMTYQLDEDGELGRQDLTIEDYHLYGGLRYRISPELMLGLEVGHVYHREIEFGRAGESGERDYSQDNAMSVRIGLVGPF